MFKELIFVRIIPICLAHLIEICSRAEDDSS